jgi:hypothetical protein
MVSVKKTSRSWHGTSIQCVQRSTRLNDGTVTQQIESGNTQTISSATKQLIKRSRTIQQTVTNVLYQPTGFTRNVTGDYVRSLESLSINNFKLQTEECIALDTVRSTVFKYMLLSLSRSSTMTIIFPH